MTQSRILKRYTLSLLASAVLFLLVFGPGSARGSTPACAPQQRLITEPVDFDMESYTFRKLKADGVLQVLKKINFQETKGASKGGEARQAVSAPKSLEALGKYQIQKQFVFQGHRLPPELREPYNQIRDLRVEDGALKFRSTGKDPYFTLRGLHIPADQVNVIAIRVRLERAPRRPFDRFRLYFETERAPGFSEARMIEASLRRDGRLRTILLYTTRATGWEGTITRIRVDPTESSLEGAIHEIALLKLTGTIAEQAAGGIHGGNLLPGILEPINNITDLRVEDGFLKLRTTGKGPYFTLTGLQLPAKEVNVIVVRAIFEKTDQYIDKLKFNVETDRAPGFNKENELVIRTPMDGTLRTFLLFPNRASGWNGTITRIRVGLGTMRKREVAIREIAFLKSPGKIDFTTLDLPSRGVARTWVSQMLQNVVFSRFLTPVEWALTLPCEPELHAQFALPGTYRYLDWRPFHVLVEVENPTGVWTTVTRLSIKKSMGPRIYNGLDLIVPLDRWSGQRVALRLTAQGNESAANDQGFVYWINPYVTSRASLPKPPPNIVLISIDTLRADHLSLYGYPRPTSPHIDAWAKKGITFKYAISHAPWTLPSHASIFTSLYPWQHQANLNFVTGFSPLADGFVTVAERFQQGGYVTGGFAGGGYVSSEVNLDQGFDSWSQPFSFGHQMARVSEWLDGHASSRFFLFLHTYEVHDYHAHHLLKMTLRQAKAFYPGYRGKLLNGFNKRNHRTFDQHIYKRAIGLESADFRFLEAMYDGQIRAVDELLGQLFEELVRWGLEDNTVVILTSDHGEEFNEHGAIKHGHSLYDEMVRVPLIIRYPKGLSQGHIVADQVRLIDLYPTLLELAGLPIPDSLEGRSLLPLILNEGEEPKRIAFSENMRRALSGVRTQTGKYIRHGEKRLAFDLVKDPLEQHPDASPADIQRLAAFQERMTHQSRGYHLLARGARMNGCPIRLTTNGRFSGTIMRYTEKSDTLMFKRKHIDVTFSLKDGDVDGLYFSVFPASAPVTVKVCLREGETEQGMEVRLGANGPVRMGPIWTLGKEVALETVSVSSPPIRDPGELRTPLALWKLQTKPAGDEDKAELPAERKDELLHRLRSLGYLD